MITDARRLEANSIVETDICVVGTGAAGITVALELIERGYRVVLLESGGLELEDEAQDLNAGDCVSTWQIDPMWTRLRQFGGTTMHWGGNCAPLDPIDFEERDWVPDSGWPFGPSELADIYPKAFAYCQLPSDRFDAKYWIEEDAAFQVSRIPLSGDLQEKVYLKSPPTRFGDVYREALVRDDSRAHVLIHAHATQIETDDSGAGVTAIEVTRPDHTRIRITARAFILAAGLENARLLLLSDRIMPGGLGNGYDTVGRWFMTHLSLRTGTAQLDIAPGAATFYGLDGWEARFGGKVLPYAMAIQPTFQAQRDNRMLNSAVFLAESYGGERSPGFTALRRIVKRVLHGQIPDDLGGDLAKVIGDADKIAGALFSRATGNARYRRLELGYFCEQAPNRDSRLRLGDAHDPFGQRRIVIDWQPSEIDKHTILQTQRMLIRHFGEAGIGRIGVEFLEMDDPWPRAPDSASHFMGSTRMHIDPKQGVVNTNCRVHGIENLYVAGGSVFPTSSSAMVTMNIVALSIRLARDIAEKLSRTASNHG